MYICTIQSYRCGRLLELFGPILQVRFIPGSKTWIFIFIIPNGVGN